MRKLLNNPLVVSLLAVAAVLFVALSLVGGGKQPRFTPETDSHTVESFEDDSGDAPPAPVASFASIREQVLAISVAGNLPDPFVMRSAPLADRGADAASPEPALERETIHLSGIWSQGESTLLLINEHIREPGDVVGRITIESADMEGAWVVHASGREFLPLGSSFTLVTSTGSSRATDDGATLAFHENP